MRRAVAAIITLVIATSAKRSEAEEPKRPWAEPIGFGLTVGGLASIGASIPLFVAAKDAEARRADDAYALFRGSGIAVLVAGGASMGVGIGVLAWGDGRTSSEYGNDGLRIAGLTVEGIAAAQLVMGSTLIAAESSGDTTTVVGSILVGSGVLGSLLGVTFLAEGFRHADAQRVVAAPVVHGARLRTAGIALTISGLVVGIGGVVVGAAASATTSHDAWSASLDPGPGGIASLALMGTGIVMCGIGIPIWVVGAHQAAAVRVTMLPTGLSVSGTF